MWFVAAVLWGTTMAIAGLVFILSRALPL